VEMPAIVERYASLIVEPAERIGRDGNLVAVAFSAELAVGQVMNLGGGDG